MRWKYGNYEDTFSVDLTAWLDARGLTIGDLTVMVYQVKKQNAREAAALVELTLGDGVTVAGNRLVFKFRSTDFGPGKLEVTPKGKEYWHGFGVRTAAMANLLEPTMKDPRLEIIPDFISD